jgi:hypothetical protein
VDDSILPLHGRTDNTLVAAMDALIEAIEAQRNTRRWWRLRGDLDALEHQVLHMREAGCHEASAEDDFGLG